MPCKGLIVYLLGQEQFPSYDYLDLKIGIGNPDELRSCIIDKCNGLDMQEMAKDVRPFLFDKKDEKKILLFTKYMEQARLI